MYVYRPGQGLCVAGCNLALLRTYLAKLGQAMRSQWSTSRPGTSYAHFYFDP